MGRESVPWFLPTPCLAERSNLSCGSPSSPAARPASTLFLKSMLAAGDIFKSRPACMLAQSGLVDFTMFESGIGYAKALTASPPISAYSALGMAPYYSCEGREEMS